MEISVCECGTVWTYLPKWHPDYRDGDEYCPTCGISAEVEIEDAELAARESD